jgi:hypothetical protein
MAADHAAGTPGLKYGDAHAGWSSIAYFSMRDRAVWRGEWKDVRTGEPVDDVKAIKLGTIWIWRT